jgi:hypothetical protein
VIVFSQRLRSRTSVCFCFRFYFSAPIDRPPLGVDAQAKASLMAVIGWSGEPVRQLGIEFAKGLDKLRAAGWLLSRARPIFRHSLIAVGLGQRRAKSRNRCIEDADKHRAAAVRHGIDQQFEPPHVRLETTVGRKSTRLCTGSMKQRFGSHLLAAPTPCPISVFYFNDLWALTSWRQQVCIHSFRRKCARRPEIIGPPHRLEHSAAFRLLAMDVADEAILGQERLVGCRSVGGIGPRPARRIALVEQASAQTIALIGSRICGRPSADTATDGVAA